MAKNEIVDGEQMTDYQFKTLFKMVLDILESSESKEEAIEKVKELISEEK